LWHVNSFCCLHCVLVWVVVFSLCYRSAECVQTGCMDVPAYSYGYHLGC
jgi:hypothetical protein